MRVLLLIPRADGRRLYIIFASINVFVSGLAVV